MKTLLQLVGDAAAGMEYLESKCCIHRWALGKGRGCRLRGPALNPPLLPAGTWQLATAW